MVEDLMFELHPNSLALQNVDDEYAHPCFQNRQPPITEEAVKKSYKRLAFMYHPDKNAGSKEAEEIFKAVTDAYHTLIKALRQNN